MKLAPEGIPFVVLGTAVFGGVLAGAVVFGGFWWTGVALWTPVAVWVPVFFRDPARTGPPRPALVLAPADGKVVSIEQVHEPDFMGGMATRVSVFMNIFSVHVNRHPVSGVVEYRDYRQGKFFNATLDKASTDNECMSLGVRCERGPVLIRQIAGLVARRIVTDHVPGNSVHQGHRLGMIRFGSRVDTFLPPEVSIKVRLSDAAFAGKTILAEWPQ